MSVYRIPGKMMEKASGSNGVRMRSQIRAGIDYCTKCHLGCSLLGDQGKQDVCNAYCDSLYCDGAAPTQGGGLRSNG